MIKHSSVHETKRLIVGAVNEQAPSGGKPMNGMNEDNACVLVIDDDASIRDSLSNLIRSMD